MMTQQNVHHHSIGELQSLNIRTLISFQVMIYYEWERKMDS